MRRRRLLAALATGAVGATAGCGYAYGGGDLRGADSVGTRGFGETRYALGDDRIAVARSGQLFWHGDEETTFEDGTNVTVADRSGDSRWRYKHRAHSVAVAGIDPVYLLDDQDRVVAIGAAPPGGDSPGSQRRPYDGEERWRVTLDDARSPLVADSRGAYVAVESGVAAVRDGEEAWRVEAPSSVESLLATDDTLLVGTSDAVVALSPAGPERWRQETDGVPRFATAGGRIVVRDRSRMTLRELASGDRLWATDAERPRGQPTMTADRVYVAARSRVDAFDAETGDREWHATVGSELSGPVIPAPEGVYAVRRGCVALAMGAGGVRWTRELSMGSCGVVGGWLDGETVAFLLDSGEIRWLQRTDQDTSLV